MTKAHKHFVGRPFKPNSKKSQAPDGAHGISQLDQGDGEGKLDASLQNGPKLLSDEPAPKSSHPDMESLSSFPDGIKVLHECRDATIDICFVHGLTGDRMSTWTAHGQSDPWPKTLLPKKLGKARIYTYGYDAYLLRKSVASSNLLIDHATNLLSDVTTERVFEGGTSRPLIFVTHSLGGIFVKKTLLLSRNHPEPHLRDIFNSTTGIIFMGTPHTGTEWMAKWAKISASTFGLVKSVNTSLLSLLQTDDQFLESIQIDFLSMVREIREYGRPFEVTCFFEELPFPVVGLVVPKKSATFEGYQAISIQANHSNMVKFVSEEENGYKRVLEELMRWEPWVSAAQNTSVAQNLGFVLNSLQLIDAAFKAFQRTVSQMDSMKRHENAFYSSCIRIGLSRVRCEESCVTILRDLPVEQSYDLIHNLRRWDSLDLQSKLQSHLGVKFERFGQLIIQTRKHLDMMRRKLKLSNDTELSAEEWLIDGSHSVFISSWMSIHFGTQSDKYEQLLTKICNDINHLRDLIVGHEQLEGASEDTKPSETAIKYWLDTQNLTRRLFDKLQYVIAQACSTHSHQAHLQIHMPRSYKAGPRSPEFLYSFELDKMSSSVYCQGALWRDIQVLCFETSQDLTAYVHSAKGMKRDHFHSPPIKPDAATLSNVCDSDVPIYSLCDTLRLDCKEGHCLGFLPHGSLHYHLHHLAFQSRQLNTVKELLSSHNGKARPIRQRRAIAVALACGVLQLYDTPWLRDSWSLDDFHIDQNDQTCLYVKVEFDASTTTKSQTIGSFKDFLPARNTVIFSLAVALLELTYGAPLSSFRIQSDRDDGMTRFRIADRLTKTINNHESGTFKSVVYWCMQPSSKDSNFSLANEGFRRRYIQDVLLPLQQEYENHILRRVVTDMKEERQTIGDEGDSMKKSREAMRVTLGNNDGRPELGSLVPLQPRNATGETHNKTMTTELRGIIRDWLRHRDERSELVRRYALTSLVTELQYIPTSQIRLESKEKAVNGHFKSTVELFKSKVESWIGAPWDWWPLGPIKRRLGVKEDRVYWRCICGEERWAEIPLDFVMPLLSAMNNFPQSSQPSQSSSNTGSAGSSNQQPGTSQSSTQSSVIKPPTDQSPVNSSSTTSGVNTPGQSHLSEYWILLIVRSGLEYGLAQIDVGSLDCRKFFQDLRSNYFELRGAIRTLFSVWRYSHCDFYLCEKFGDSEFVPKTRDKFPGTSDEADYYFVPREMEDRMPPVTPHEFNRRFYRRFHACRCVTPRPRLFMFHRCRRQSGGHSRDVLDLFPKKRTKLEEGGNGRRLFWGIYAREAIALRWVLGYNFVCTLPMLVFFFVWVLRLGPDEIQNASVPVSVMLAMLSLFWSVFFSSLPFGRSQ